MFQLIQRRFFGNSNHKLFSSIAAIVFLVFAAKSALAAVVTDLTVFGQGLGAALAVSRSPLPSDLEMWVTPSSTCSSGAGALTGDCSRANTAVIADVVFNSAAPIIFGLGLGSNSREDALAMFDILFTNKSGIDFFSLAVDVGYVGNDGFHMFETPGPGYGYLPSFGYSRPPYPLPYATAINDREGIYGLPATGDVWGNSGLLDSIDLVGIPDTLLNNADAIFPIAIRFTPNVDLRSNGEGGLGVPEPSGLALFLLSMVCLSAARKFSSK